MNNSLLGDPEINQLRDYTPGCANVIHFNNAGASLAPDVVFNAVVDYLREEAVYGGYETEARNLTCIDEVYRLIA